MIQKDIDKRSQSLIAYTCIAYRYKTYEITNLQQANDRRRWRTSFSHFVNSNASKLFKFQKVLNAAVRVITLESMNEP